MKQNADRTTRSEGVGGSRCPVGVPFCCLDLLDTPITILSKQNFPHRLYFYPDISRPVIVPDISCQDAGLKVAALTSILSPDPRSAAPDAQQLA